MKPFIAVYFDAVDKLGGFSSRSLISDISLASGDVAPPLAEREQLICLDTQVPEVRRAASLAQGRQSQQAFQPAAECPPGLERLGAVPVQRLNACENVERSLNPSSAA